MIVRKAFVAALPLAALLALPAHALTLNGFRAQHHLKPLRPSSALTAYARAHAYDMARRGSLDHDGFYAHASAAAGSVFAENVLWGCDSESCAIAKWAASPGHRANMLRGDLDHYGIASVVSGRRRYWVLELSGEGPRPPRLLRASVRQKKTRHKKK